MTTTITSILILATSLVAQARLIPHWSELELLDKSDLVVIAIPTSSTDTLEHTDLPGFLAQHVIGVETGFAVSTVVKGDKEMKNFILHHYRTDKNTVPNGPSFVSFKPEEKRSFRLYLIKEADGRYAPTVGQIDPAIQGITEMTEAAHPDPNPSPQVAVTESIPQAQTKPPALSPDLKDSLRFSMELTDGSRIVGSPVDEDFTLKTSLSTLNLRWQLVKAIEKPAEGNEFSIVFRNGDRANGALETKAIALRTVLGDLNVPLALTRRVGIDALAGGSGPVAYWSFNDPANLGADDSGHDHTLTVERAQSTDGRIGKAVATRENRENQGLAEYLIIDSHPDLQFSGDFTLAVWAWRSAPFYDGDQIIAKEGEFSLRRYQFPTERYNVELFGKQGVSLAKVSETKSGLPLESWTLIVLTRQDDRLSIRVNDLPAVEAKVADGETGGDKPLMIGCSPTGYPWQGKLDEIKKWNRALSEEEQCELFRNPAAMKDSGPQ